MLKIEGNEIFRNGFEDEEEWEIVLQSYETDGNFFLNPIFEFGTEESQYQYILCGRSRIAEFLSENETLN